MAEFVKSRLQERSRSSGISYGFIPPIHTQTAGPPPPTAPPLPCACLVSTLSPCISPDGAGAAVSLQPETPDNPASRHPSSCFTTNPRVCPQENLCSS